MYPFNERLDASAPYRPDRETMQRYKEDPHELLRACSCWQMEAQARARFWEELDIGLSNKHFNLLSYSLVAFADQRHVYCTHAITDFSETSCLLLG